MSGAFSTSDVMGSIIGAVGNYLTAQQTSDANQSINKKNITWQAQSLMEQQAWQEHMRSTAYQATMQDMKAAGLNPMLAFSRGPTSWGGASSSPGSSLGAVQPDIAGGLEHGVRALTTARSAPLNRQLLTEQAEVARGQARQANATADNQEVQARLAPALAAANIEASMGSAASGHAVARHQNVQADNSRNTGPPGQIAPLRGILRDWVAPALGQIVTSGAQLHNWGAEIGGRVGRSLSNPYPAGHRGDPAFNIGPSAPRR